MPSKHLILCCPLLPLPSIFRSIRVFANESSLLIRWPKYWSFSFSISPSNESPVLRVKAKHKIWSPLAELHPPRSTQPMVFTLCCPLLLLPSIFPSIRVFSSESVLRIRWPKECSFSISPSNEYSGLISFRMDWLDLLAVQGTLKCLRQNHSSKASILWHSDFLQSNSHIHT